MEYSITYHENSGIIEVRCWGPAQVQGFIDYSRELAAHPQLGPRARLLFDHTGLEIESLTAGQISEIAQFLKSLAPRMKGIHQAIVTRADSTLAKARIFQVLISELEEKGRILTRIFTDYEEALRWLSSTTYIEL